MLTTPLVAFLLAVCAAVTYGLLDGPRASTCEQAIDQLADGDLDGAERRQMLLRTIELARSSDELRAHWAGLLAAVALEDEQAFATFRGRLPAGVAAVPAESARRWLDLGDPLLRNVMAAMMAERVGDQVAAGRAWQQVAAQARMTGNAFAATLAR